MWKRERSILTGGITGIGVDPSSKFLIVVSHSGRGVFDLSNGERLARDYERMGDWYLGTKCRGLGPLRDIEVSIFGIGSETSTEVLEEIPESLMKEGLTEFVGAALSPDENRLCIAFSDVIEVFRKNE